MAKGGRFVNPTDKARKEARKKELKKNKKQRQLVRSAVIEKKDPTQIITDLEKLDQLEYDALLGSGISDSLYKDKRKKLKETWERVLKHYSREDPDKHQELKKLESDYEASHNKKMRQYEAIKAAQEVKLEDIPLPPDPHGEHPSDDGDDPLDDSGISLPDCITYASVTGQDKLPGCPPGVPPSLKDIVSKLKSQQTFVVLPTQHSSQMVQVNRPNARPIGNTSSLGAVPTMPPQRRAAYLSSGLLPTPYNFDRNRIEKSTVASLPKLNDAPLIKTKSALLPTPPSKDLKQQQQQPQSAAIIESKPVIFRPKVTKFVPSAVRKKQAATTATTSINNNPDNNVKT